MSYSTHADTRRKPLPVTLILALIWLVGFITCLVSLIGWLNTPQYFSGGDFPQQRAASSLSMAQHATPASSTPADWDRSAVADIVHATGEAGRALGREACEASQPRALPPSRYHAHNERTSAHAGRRAREGASDKLFQ